MTSTKVSTALRELLARRGLDTDLVWRKTDLAWEEGPDTRGVLLIGRQGPAEFSAYPGVRYEPAMAVYAAISGIEPKQFGVAGLVGTNLQFRSGRGTPYDCGTPEGLAQFADDVIAHGLPWVEAHATLEDQERLLRKDADTGQAVQLAALLLSQGRHAEAMDFLMQVREWAVREAAALVEHFDEQIARARDVDVEGVMRGWVTVR